jgi:hypothetical protein
MKLGMEDVAQKITVPFINSSSCIADIKEILMRWMSWGSSVSIVSDYRLDDGFDPRQG